MMRLLASPSKRKWLWIVPPVVALLVAVKTLNSSPPTNRASTAPDAPDKSLRPRAYALPLDAVETAARQAASGLTTYGRAWRLPSTGRGAETASERIIDVEVPVLVFIDDLTVTLRASGESATRVDVASQSRLGKGDFGENRRHVLQFLAALDARLEHNQIRE